MEAVLEVYQTAYNLDTPVICIDEATKQLVRETQAPISTETGHPERADTADARVKLHRLYPSTNN
jgi:hypothetical protein